MAALSNSIRLWMYIHFLNLTNVYVYILGTHIVSGNMLVAGHTKVVKSWFCPFWAPRVRGSNGEVQYGPLGASRVKGLILAGVREEDFIGRLIRVLKIIGPKQIEDLFSLRENKQTNLLLLVTCIVF